MPIEIHQNRSVVLTLAPSPIIDAEISNLRGRNIGRSGLDPAQDRVVAHADRQSFEQPLSGQATWRITDCANDFGESRGCREYA